MRCTLLIPHLFWPGDTADTAASGLELPALTRLLSRARVERYPAIAPEAWLCQAFEVERQQDWPVAPLTLALDGEASGDAYWLRADPVHLRVERDHLVLIDNALFDVTIDEAQIFGAALNAHFAGTGFTFRTPAAKRWYATLPRAPQLATHSTSEVAGKDVRAYLPSGADALAWHGRFNEMQMLFHALEVNETREASGQPVINSVWLWGGGTRPEVPGRHFDAVWSNDALANALGAAADAHTAALPPDGSAWLTLAASSGRQGAHLIVAGELGSALAYRDGERWRSGLSALEAQWFAPFLDGLRHGKITELALIVPGESSCSRFEITRADLFKFWRSARRLSSYA